MRKDEVCCNFSQTCWHVRVCCALVSVVPQPFKHRWNLGNFLDPKRLNDGQRSITAARSCEPMVMLNSVDKASFDTQPGTVDFDVFDQRERALLYKLEERPKSGLIPPSRCECPHSSSLQERFFRPSISTHQMIDQRAQTVVSSSRTLPVRTSAQGRWPVSSLVSLSSSLPAGWPCTRATTRVPAPRDSMLHVTAFLGQDTNFGVEHWSTDL